MKGIFIHGVLTDGFQMLSCYRGAAPAAFSSLYKSTLVTKGAQSDLDFCDFATLKEDGMRIGRFSPSEQAHNRTAVQLAFFSCSSTSIY